jgi:hypothetical protein
MISTCGGIVQLYNAGQPSTGPVLALGYGNTPYRVLAGERTRRTESLAKSALVGKTIRALYRF